jgi:hypothetical protein
MSFVTLRYSGRTGNQLFQAATAYAHAKRNGANVLFPNKNKSKYTSEPTLKLLPVYEGQHIKFTHEEPGDFTYQPIPYVPDMELVGYFQTEKHFKEYWNELRELFLEPTPDLKGTVSIHVRRGDYLRHPTKHPVVTKEYILEAMSMFFGFNYLFFSDEIEWCKENFSHIRGAMFSTNTDEQKDLELMASCEHNIISNSSFSWWGAWLNANPNKIVIAPKVWFGEGNSHLKTENIIPENWDKI